MIDRELIRLMSVIGVFLCTLIYNVYDFILVSSGICSLFTRVFISMVLYGVFFFFQAEDGIRDIGVTGVQTCALPICGGDASIAADLGRDLLLCVPIGHGQVLGQLDLYGHRGSPVHASPLARAGPRHLRSEERRVGKECRSRWSPYH